MLFFKEANINTAPKISELFQSVQEGEWGALLEKSERLDRDAPEALETQALVEQLGFDQFILVNRYVLPVAGPIQIAISNWREDWYHRYWQKGYIRVDPVVARMMSCFRPFDWQDVGPLSPLQQDFFKDAMAHGFCDGIAGAVRESSDAVSFFSVSSGKPVTREAKERAMERMFYFTAVLYDRLRDQILRKYNLSTIVLTGKQREALTHALRGLSRRDASREMGCSETNYVRHIDAARRKLGEATTAGAIRKAVAMNMIRPYEILPSKSW